MKKVLTILIVLILLFISLIWGLVIYSLVPGWIIFCVFVIFFFMGEYKRINKK